MDLKDLRQKIGQTMIVGFDGPEPKDEVRKFIHENNVGGVILFTRNIESPVQLANLNNDLQTLSAKRADMPAVAQQLIISIDMEGGRVARLKAPFTQWPPMQILGEIGSAALGFKFAETMGKELTAVGINLDYSPCVDVLTNPQNTVIGDRAFGTEPEIVAKMASALVRGFIKAGVIPCVKHFPGHGDTLVDSHEDLPVVKHELSRLELVEFVPFKKSFRARAELLMTAHLVLDKVDPGVPATLSKKILQDILRGSLGYRNAIMTDDMEMKAITKNFAVGDAAIRAVQAGCNILLYCHSLDIHKEALEALVKAVSDGKISESIIENNYQMMIKLKKDNLKPYKPVDVTKVSKEIGHPEHLTLAKQIARKEIPAGLTT
ncbi:MAG: beta-N-acetylhexosaminidase [Oligoflexia bacterium]|nr:beta-N-acetylhexosaminidase [Oligoflexia bacterium]